MVLVSTTSRHAEVASSIQLEEELGLGGGRGSQSAIVLFGTHTTKSVTNQHCTSHLELSFQPQDVASSPVFGIPNAFMPSRRREGGLDWRTQTRSLYQLDHHPGSQLEKERKDLEGSEVGEAMLLPSTGSLGCFVSPEILRRPCHGHRTTYLSDYRPANYTSPRGFSTVAGLDGSTPRQKLCVQKTPCVSVRL